VCTLVILRRPGHDWPLLLAANRDEVRHRPAEPPARHWPDRPEVVADLDPDAYRPFNLVIADTGDAYWLRHGGDGEIRVHAIPPGLHMLSDTELDDTTGCLRIRGYLQRFQSAEIPDPRHGRWQQWKNLLASRTYPAEAGPEAAMNLGGTPRRFRHRLQRPHRRTGLSGTRITAALAPRRRPPGPLSFRAG